MQQVGASGERTAEQGLVAAALRGVERGAVVDLGFGQLALAPAGDAQALVDRAEHVQRQVGHRNGLQQPLDYIPLADRAELVEQGAGGEQRGGGALVVGAREIDRVARRFQLVDAAAEHGRERRRVVALDRAHVAVQPADHGLLVDAHLLGQPPLLEPEFGDAVAQPGAVQQDRGVDLRKKLRHDGR